MGSLAKPGLKKLRNSKSKEPMHVCERCKCKRYNPCKCSKKQ